MAELRRAQLRKVFAVMRGRATIHELTRQAIPVEVGCTARSSGAAGVPSDYLVDIDLPAYALSGREGLSLGSHFVRAGPAYGEPPTGASFRIEMPEAESIEGPGHPMQDATASEIRRLPLLPTATLLQIPDVADAPVIADAPLRGLIELCLAVRGGWTFLEDCVNEAVEAELLLDWAAESLCQAYASTLPFLGSDLACIVYRDDFGTPVGSYFPLREHRRLIMPRLARIFDAIGAASSAPIAAAISGASLDLLGSLRDHGCAIISVDPHARGMVAPEIRRRVGRSVVLHRTADLVALGRALAAGDLKSISMLACELAAAMPVIAAPTRPIKDAEFEMVGRASAFLGALDGDDLKTLADVGPDRNILARAAATSPLQARERTKPRVVPRLTSGLSVDPRNAVTAPSARADVSHCLPARSL